MNLGISGRKALVCASSQGLGRACARALGHEGCVVFINARNEGPLRVAASEIALQTGAKVIPVPADITTEEGRATLVEACPDADILVTNNAGPAPGSLADWDHAAILQALESNFLAAALLIRAFVPGMRERKFGRIVNITSAMVKSPAPPMGLSTAARAALTALAKSLSIECARDNVTINNLLPYRIDTGRQQFFAERQAAAEKIAVEEARARIAATVAAGRMGRPEEFGAACAFLCSAQASFISGQNLQIDGGSYAALV